MGPHGCYYSGVREADSSLPTFCLFGDWPEKTWQGKMAARLKGPPIFYFWFHQSGMLLLSDFIRCVCVVEGRGYSPSPALSVLERGPVARTCRKRISCTVLSVEMTRPLRRFLFFHPSVTATLSLSLSLCWSVLLLRTFTVKFGNASFLYGKGIVFWGAVLICQIALSGQTSGVSARAQTLCSQEKGLGEALTGFDAKEKAENGPCSCHLPCLFPKS